MTEPAAAPRPHLVTTALVLTVSGCLLVLANLFSVRDELRGTTFQQGLREAEQRAQGTGLTAAQMTSLLHGLVFVSGALAAAVTVLAVYAWRRHRGAWLAMFVLAALMLLTLPVAGLFGLLLLMFATGFLASRPAREWFATQEADSSRPPGSPVRTEPGWPTGTRPVDPGQPGQLGQPQYPGQEQYPGQPEYPGQPHYPPQPQYPGYPGGHPGTHPRTPPYGSVPPAYVGYGAARGPRPDPEKRPGTVTAAAVITWATSGLVAAVVAVVMLVLVADREQFLREVDRQAQDAHVQITREQVLAITWTVSAVMLFWCLAAALLAVAAFRRSKAGRIGLAVSAGMTVLVSVLLIVSIVAGVTLLLAAAVLALLFTGGANDWYARRDAGAPAPPPSYPAPPTSNGAW